MLPVKVIKSDVLFPGFDDIFMKSLSPFDIDSSGALIKSDLVEYSDRYEVKVDLPGISKENISVDFQDGYLKVKVEQVDETTEEDEGKHWISERSEFCSQRTYGFPEGNVQQDKISASFDNGLLKIVLPKKKQDEEQKKKSIDIK